jgi:hypothetical protein
MTSGQALFAGILGSDLCKPDRRSITADNRRRIKNVCLAAASLIGLGGLGMPALADQIIQVDSVALPYSETVDITGTNLNGTTGEDVPANETTGQLAGEIVFTVHNTNPVGPEYTIAAWCIDLFHTIGLGSSTAQYTEGPLSTDDYQGDGMGTPLSNSQIQEIGDLVAWGTAQMQSDPSDALSAEVQAAIWEVEYSGLTVSNNSDVTALNIEAVETAAMGAGNAGQLIGLNGVQGQAFVTPAPAIGQGWPALVMLAGTLIGGGFWERRGRRRSRAGSTAEAAA